MSLLQNVLSLWDIYTLTPVWNWPSLHVEEFLLTTEADSPSSVTWYASSDLPSARTRFLPDSVLIIHYILHSKQDCEQTDRVKTISLLAHLLRTNRQYEPLSDCVRKSASLK